MTATTAATTQPITMLRLPTVLQRRGRQKSAHHNDVREGLWTKPVKPGRRMSLWPESEVNQLLAAEIAGATAEQVKELVRRKRPGTPP
jgi:prophage regulatory protein